MGVVGWVVIKTLNRADEGFQLFRGLPVSELVRLHWVLVYSLVETGRLTRATIPG